MTLPWLRLIASALALAFGALLGPLACNSDSTTTAGVTHPTMVEVSPATFLGDRVCADEAGGVRRYVATLFDVTDDGAGGADGAGDANAGEAAQGPGGADAGSSAAPPRCGGFQLPSSAPVSCLAGVGFGFVVSGRRYCAEIDAYDTDQLEPRGSGTRMMVEGDPSDGEAPSRDAAEVTPRWQTSCTAGAVAASSQIVPARGCLPLWSEQPATDSTTLRVETSALLGGLSCGPGLGQVAELEVALEPVADYTPQTVPCGEAAVYTGLPAGRVLSAYVQAFEAGSRDAGLPALAGAKCHGLTKPDVSVVAECAALSTSGTLRVDFQAALEALGVACDASLADVRVNVPGEEGERRFPPPDCLEPFDHGFPVGDAAVTVTAVPKDGPATSVNCGKAIEPGRLVVAGCPF